MLEATLELAQANLDANSSLYRNGRITRDLVYRAEADVLEVEQQRLFAASRVRLSQSYVNLLRAAPLDSPLPDSEIDPGHDRSIPGALRPATRRPARRARGAAGARGGRAGGARRSRRGRRGRRGAAGPRPRGVQAAPRARRRSRHPGRGVRHQRGGPIRARHAGAALERVPRRGGSGGAPRGARAHRGVSRDSRSRRAAGPTRRAACARGPGRRRSHARDGCKARRRRRRRVSHRQAASAISDRSTRRNSSIRAARSPTRASI